MRKRMRYAASVAGAGALVAAAVTGAVASGKGPFHPMVRTQVKHTKVNGALDVSNVLRVSNNASIYGHLYAHNAEQVWKGLLVRTDGLTVQSGGIRSDSLEVSGPLQATQANIQNNLQAGAISGTSLTLTQGVSAAGKITGAGVDAGAGALTGASLTVSGHMAGNGLDAGAGGVTTTGGITAASLTASGGLTASTLNTSGNITAGGKISATNLAVTGNVDFTNANITGLNLSSLNLQNVGLQALTVGSTSSSAVPLTLSANGQSTSVGVNQSGALTVTSLSLGSSSSTSPALLLNGNGKSVGFGVDTSGNLTLSSSMAVTGSIVSSGNLTLAGNESVAGTLSTNALQGVVPSGSSTPGALSINSSALTINGPTTHNGGLTLGGGNDLIFSTGSTSSGTNATHILRAGDQDVAGTSTVTIGSGGTSGSQSVTFSQPYSSVPVITVTPNEDPNPNGSAPKIWVTPLQNSGQYTGFVIHMALPLGQQAPANGINTTFNYEVIG